MCESALSITPLFDDITEENDHPLVWIELLQFVKAHSGSKIRRLRGEPNDLVDMVIIDVLRGCRFLEFMESPQFQFGMSIPLG